MFKSENCYYETSINMYPVKLHVPSSAVLKHEYNDSMNREVGNVNAKASNF